MIPRVTPTSGCVLDLVEEHPEVERALTVSVERKIERRVVARRGERAELVLGESLRYHDDAAHLRQRISEVGKPVLSGALSERERNGRLLGVG